MEKTTSENSRSSCCTAVWQPRAVSTFSLTNGVPQMTAKLKCCTVLLTGVLFSLVAHAAAASAVHVAPNGHDANSGAVDKPVRSLGKAIEIARSQKSIREIRLAKDTVARLAAPIRLDARDSGLHISCEGGKASLSGGELVVGWKAGSDGVWRASCPVEGSPRELFVNGRRALRARFPNEGWLRIERTLPDRRSGFTFGQGDLPESIIAGNGLELVFLHDWSISRIAVASIDRQAHTLRTTAPIGCAAAHYAIDHFEKQPRYLLEGGSALLDAPGEWAWSDGEILYLPRPGESLSNAVAVVPRLRQLLEISPGDDGQAPKNIRFEGIRFEHCRFDIPRDGYASGQATMHEWRDGSGRGGRPFVPAAVRVSGAADVKFSRCSFSRLGGSGVWLGEGARDCLIENCELVDISGNGINIGESGTQNVASGISVKKSSVNNCGRQFFGSVGVWIGMAEGCTIERCEIRDLPYTGVSVGWRWNPTPSPCRQHRIVDNHIHHVMQVLSDGGGIYTLGRQPGTVLSGNHIHDVPLNAGRAQSNGIFMDEGTTDLLVEGNTIHAIAKSPIRFHKAGENTIRGNTLGIGPAAKAFTFNSTDSKVIRFENNRELPDGGDELKAAAAQDAGENP